MKEKELSEKEELLAEELAEETEEAELAEEYPIEEAEEKPGKKKKKLSTGKKILVIVLALIALFILGLGGFTLFKMYRMSVGAIKRVPKPTVPPYGIVTPEPGIVIISGDPDDITQDHDDPLDPNMIYPDPIYIENAIDPDVLNILVLGEDARSSEETGRSDVMLIVSYNQKTRTVKAISVLRDTWMYIPGRNVWNRINAAYRFGGVGLAINTINSNLGLDIQYYMKTDFENMVQIVDMLGGLDIPLTVEEEEYYNTIHPSDPVHRDELGWAHMNGAQVLAHCRNRTIGNGDWSRTERQRSVMSAFFTRAKQEKDVAALTSLIYRLMDYVETNMTPWDMISMGVGVVFGSNFTTPQKGTIPCPGSWSYAYEGKMAVIHIDLEKNKQWIHQFIYGP